MTTRRRPRRRTSEGGFVLLAGLFLVVLVGGIAVALLEEGKSAKAWLSLHEDNLKALELAEVGLIRAEMEIRAQVDHGDDGIGTVSGPHAGGTFEVTVHDDPVSDDRWLLRARGDFGYAIRRVEIGVRRRVDRRYVEGLFALDEMVLGGNLTTDSYDSSLGAYATQASSIDGGGSFANPGGHVGSNKDIKILGTSTWVRGNAIPGPYRQTTLKGHAHVSGDMAPRLDLIDIQPEPYAQFAAAAAINDNAAVFGSGGGNKIKYTAKDMSLSVNANQEVVLTTGTYFFSDVKINGGAKIIIDGHVEIYVTGSLDLSGGALVNPGRPSDLTVHAHPYSLPEGYTPAKGTSVELSGGAAAALTMFGPGADLKVGGGGHLFGAAIAKTIDMGGSVEFHYDTALGQIEAEGIATLERLYWRDLAPPRR